MVTNLEQAARTRAITGYQPQPQNYPEAGSTDWYSFVSPAKAALGPAIQSEYERQAKAVEGAYPEAIREAMRPMFARNIARSGVAQEAVGRAATERQELAEKLRSLGTIKSLEAFADYETDIGRGGIAKVAEDRKRYEYEEDLTRAQNRVEEEKRRQTAAALGALSTGRTPVNQFLAGANPIDQALAGALSKAGINPAILGVAGLGGASQILFGKKFATEGLFKSALDKVFGPELFPKLKNEGLAGVVKGFFESKPPVTDMSSSLKKTIDEWPEFGASGQIDAQGNIIRDGQVIPRLPQNQMMRDAVYREDVSFPQTKTVDYTETPIEREARLASQLGEMTFEQEAAIRNMPRVGETVDIEEAARLGSLEGGSRGESLMDFDDIDRSNIEELPVEEIFKKPSITESNLVEQFNEDTGKMELVETFNQLEPKNYIDAFRDSIPYVPDEALGAAMEADYFQDGLQTTFEEFADEYSPSLGKGLLDTGLALAISSALNPEGLKGVASNPLSFIGPQIMSQGGAGPLALAKSLSSGAALGTTALTSLAAGLPMSLIGAGIASNRKARAKAEAEYTTNLAGSRPFNFVTGTRTMIGDTDSTPESMAANRNFETIDMLTGANKAFETNSPDSLAGGESLSARGQQFARELGINYTNPDPDVQNMSQKWLGLQDLYSDLIPELRPVFTDALLGIISRQESEIKSSNIINNFMQENPQIEQLRVINKEISELTEMNKSEGDWNVENDIQDLKMAREELKKNIPIGFENVRGFQKIPLDFINLTEEVQE
tara:strand:- start:2069 stop:4408 length:2340 start_codon:yes stop_codon:yes gene_type:complete